MSLHPPEQIVTGRAPDGRGVEIHVDHGLISMITETDVDADAPMLLPGLIDLQVNGYAGYDLNEDLLSPDTVHGLTDRLAAEGTTTYLPTLITGTPERIDSTLRTIAQACKDDPSGSGAIAGVHLEGPYLSAEPGCSGAHPVELMRDPDISDIDRWQEASGGRIRVITLAPERPGSAAFIAAATARGIVCSIGHTHASPADIRTAVEAGATMSTHLGNGSAAMLPRHDNYIWAQLAESSLTAGLIADGQHLPWYTFSALLAAKGDARTVLVSDSAALAGSQPGRYRSPIGGDVTVGDDGRLSITDTEYLAGSGASLLECVRWAHRVGGVDLPRAVDLASRRPAAFIGLADRGSLSVGRHADVIVVDEELQVSEVYAMGERVR